MPSSAGSGTKRGVLRVYLAVGLQTLISAGTYLIAKGVLAELAPLEVAWLRFVGGGLVYAAVFAATGRGLLPPREAIPRVLLLGLVGLVFNQCFFLVGLSRSTPTHAAILYALTPACVLVGSRIFLAERISLGKALGIVVAFAGVAVVLLEKGLQAAKGPLVGDLFILGAVLSWAGYTVWARPVSARYGSLTATGWALMAGGLFALPFGPLFVHPAALAQVSAAAWAGVAFLVVVTSVISYLLWGYALARLEAAKVAVFANLQPVATALLSWAILGEGITLPVLVGGLLVIAGVTATQRG